MISVFLSLALLSTDPITAAEVASALAQVRQVREAMSREMPDYRSARFRDVYATAQGAHDEGRRAAYFCGRVSSPRRNGGDGWTAFVAVEGVVKFEDLEDGKMFVDDMCGPTDPRDTVDRAALLQAR